MKYNIYLITFIIFVFSIISHVATSSGVPLNNVISDNYRINKQVTGKVTDTSSSPLSGVTIHVKGINRIGTTTDDNGRFILIVIVVPAFAPR